MDPSIAPAPLDHLEIYVLVDNYVDGGLPEFAGVRRYQLSHDGKLPIDSFLRYSDKEMRIAKRRKYEQTAEFTDRYRWQAGVEATISKYNKRTGVKYLRVGSLKAVRYCATLKVLGVNIFRAAVARAASMMPDRSSLRGLIGPAGRYFHFSKSVLLQFGSIIISRPHRERIEN